jgi:hypothetical protein
MKTAILPGLILSMWLALGCGGKVITEGNGNAGGGGTGGSSGGAQQGGSGPCSAVECTEDPGSCSCVTLCPGDKLRADCSMKDGTVVCECHLGAGYLGTCGQPQGSICTLPGGCCEQYL